MTPRPPEPLRCYLYTIPKAGTYLLDRFLTELGFTSTGWHLTEDHYLDTAAFPPEVNKQQPSAARKVRPYLASFRQIPPGGHAFGHFNPMFVPPRDIKRLRLHVVAVRRHPREVLVSEFVDFRFRRSDVPFVNATRVPDAGEAFAIYLREHGPVVRSICANHLLLQDMARNPHYLELLGSQPAHFADFQRFLSPQTGANEAMAIAQYLRRSMDRSAVEAARVRALAADNKTRALETQLPFERESLWTEVTDALYRGMGFPALARSLGYPAAHDPGLTRTT